MSSPPDLRNLPVDEARRRMLAGVAPLEAQAVALDDALGRTLAEPIAARRDQPPFDASAMDGWAVRRPDAVEGARLAMVGESAAGKAFAGVLEAGQAVRIFTGAPVPAGADQVLIQEHARRDGDAMVVGTAGGPAYIRRRGGDLAAGATVLDRGEPLDPWRIALAAAAGADSLRVVRRPRVTILVNGEELAAPGAAPLDWQIADSAGPGLAGLVTQWGGQAERLAAVGDDARAIESAVAAAQADLVVAVGGASVGDHDLVKPALAGLGLSLAVETVDVRPGKPTWFGALADGRRVLGLPGNPASAFVCAQLFLKPLILALLGRDHAPALIPAVLGADLPANDGRAQWLRAQLGFDEAGRTVATPFEQQDSSLVGVFARSGALLPRARGAPAAKIGQGVEILPLERLR